ncbi:MAG: branched-chain amino acid ABC transporter permease [Rhizobiaceae bacterium]|nr:branched-chain amino acid ABC transporter permease [Rhizobiaceae bacterium]
MISERYFNIAILALLIIVPTWAYFADEPFTITLMTRAAIFALAAVGLNLALGTGGLVSFGHAAFFGMGGYVMGILAHHAQTFTPVAEVPFLIEGTKSMPVIWLVSILLSAVLAWVIGFLSLRTSGVYFIMITLAFAQMMFFFSISWSEYGGEDGLSIYVRNSFPGLNTLDPIQFYILCLAILLIVLGAMARVVKSPFGLALNAARQSPQRVDAVGLNVKRLRLVAFIISGAITGLAGALFADLNRFVSPTMFSWQLSGEIMVFIIIGGVGRLFGPVVGALIFVALEHFLGGLSDFWHIYLGLLLLMIVLFGKGGIIGMICGREKSHG